ncbi:hypothetical protein [Sulfurovum sp.]|uniref:hypothetical protein n=1 Tax=Sulfurovum sp. TaxID=1969726 RepID=UPI003564EE1B
MPRKDTNISFIVLDMGSISYNECIGTPKNKFVPKKPNTKDMIIITLKLIAKCIKEGLTCAPHFLQIIGFLGDHLNLSQTEKVFLWQFGHIRLPFA